MPTINITALRPPGRVIIYTTGPSYFLPDGTLNIVGKIPFVYVVPPVVVIGSNLDNVRCTATNNGTLRPLLIKRRRSLASPDLAFAAFRKLRYETSALHDTLFLSSRGNYSSCFMCTQIMCINVADFVAITAGFYSIVFTRFGYQFARRKTCCFSLKSPTLAHLLHFRNQPFL